MKDKPAYTEPRMFCTSANEAPRDGSWPSFHQVAPKSTDTMAATMMRPTV